MNELNRQHIRGDCPQSAIAVREIGNAVDRSTTAAQAGAQESAASLHQQADDLQAQLDATARAHGFLDYADIYHRTVEKREPLDKESKDGLLKDLAPLAHKGSQHVDVDATGVPAIADVVRSVVLLIRVLLLDYTADEVGFLAAQVKTPRLEATHHASDVRHAETLRWMQAMSRPTWLSLKGRR